jgi:hypothetical protein
MGPWNSLSGRSGLSVLVETIAIGVALVGQENVKTKHPQLHYESKLYMLLQGGSKLTSWSLIHTLRNRNYGTVLSD